MNTSWWRALVLGVILLTVAGCVCSPRAKSVVDGQPPQQDERIEYLAERYVGTIDARTSGAAAMTNLDQADRLMTEWGAINFTVSDVKLLFVAPTTQEEDHLDYWFDTGRAGAVWRFCAQNDRIVAVERHILE